MATNARRKKVIERHGGGTDEALARLRAVSQHRHHQLVEVTRHIVDEAVRRACSRGHHR